jgi:hypothetical protein
MTSQLRAVFSEKGFEKILSLRPEANKIFGENTIAETSFRGGKKNYF